MTWIEGPGMNKPGAKKYPDRRMEVTKAPKSKFGFGSVISNFEPFVVRITIVVDTFFPSKWLPMQGSGSLVSSFD